MCDPMTAAIVAGGITASAAGSHLQTKDANKTAKLQQWAKEDAYRSGMGRQKAFADEAGESFRPMVESQGADNFQSQLGTNVAKRLQAFNDGSSNTGDYSVPGNVPKNVSAAMEKAFGESESKTGRDKVGLATLGGYGDTQLNQNLGRNEFVRAFGNLSDTAQRDANLIGMEMNTAANNANRGASIWPTLLKTTGQAATMYGSAGAPGLNTTGATMAPPSNAFIGPMPKQPHFGGYGPFGG